MSLALLAILPGLFIWTAILVLPWRPWSTRESLDTEALASAEDLADVTILIPARNEAENIANTLNALRSQGQDLNIIVVDDQSSDDTQQIAKSSGLPNLIVVDGKAKAQDWSGKLWALEQGRKSVDTRYTLLLDADISISPGLLATAVNKVKQEKLQMLSLMAFLKMETNWEKWLMPAFIFFFKLLYPFHLANNEKSRFAAAAGGFILLETDVLDKLGGFESIKHALIDDCSLAGKIKKAGHKTWTGLTHSAVSTRNYDQLQTIWQMVTRTAYTQLFYSPLLLLICTLLMLAAFVMPLWGLWQPRDIVIYAAVTLFIQIWCYWPTIKYYNVKPYWVLSLPFAGIIYLIMTWHSAYQYYFCKGATWKGRHYQ
ncbi:MAG: glycosyltransferase [Pseudomonadota bacterium]